MLKKIIKPILILLALFFLTSLQAAFFPLNLVILFVLVWAVIRPARESLLIAFAAGLLLDLANLRPLGSSSLLLLLVVFFLVIYARKFDPSHPAFLAIFVFLSVAFYHQLWLEPWLIEALILTGLSIILRLISKSYLPEFDHDSIKLKVEK